VCRCASTGHTQIASPRLAATQKLRSINEHIVERGAAADRRFEFGRRANGDHLAQRHKLSFAKSVGHRLTLVNDSFSNDYALLRTTKRFLTADRSQ
jgi:hypothetical protein